MYFEFKFPIKDYLCTIRIKEIIYEFVIPFAFSLLLFCILFKSEIQIGINGFLQYAIGVLAILIGFSITGLTVISTACGDNIEELKKTKSRFTASGVVVNNFRLIHAHFTYAVIVELFSVCVMALELVVLKIHYSKMLEYCFIALSSFLLGHIILLNIRNVTNFYLVFSRVKSK